MESLQRSNRNLEHRLSLVQGELATAQATLNNTQRDYESYKVSRATLPLTPSHSLYPPSLPPYFICPSFFLLYPSSPLPPLPSPSLPPSLRPSPPLPLPPSLYIMCPGPCPQCVEAEVQWSWAGRDQQRNKVSICKVLLIVFLFCHTFIGKNMRRN